MSQIVSGRVALDPVPRTLVTVDVEQPRDLCGRQKLFTVGRYADARSSRRAMCLINAETNDSPAPLLGAGVRAVVEETSELAMDVAHFEMDVSAAVPYG